MGTVMLNHYRVQWRYKGSKPRLHIVASPAEEMVPKILYSAVLMQTMKRRMICIESIEDTGRQQTVLIMPTAPLMMGG